MKSGIKLTYLLDANAIIDFVGGLCADSFRATLFRIIQNGTCATSIIAATEAHKWRRNQRRHLHNRFALKTITNSGLRSGRLVVSGFNSATVQTQIARFIYCRFCSKYDLTLISSDKRGFHKIDALHILRPAFKS